VETWGDYSMMLEQRAGMLAHDDQLASQWAWRQAAEDESHIYWGKALGGKYRERFILDGEWVMLDGWWDNGTYYRIETDFAEMCDINGENVSPLPIGGLEHYTLREIPEEPYILRTSGTVTEEFSGNQIYFGHTQAYWPPAEHSNPHLPDAMCIRQWESWWDNNGTIYERKIDREQYLARGVGPGFYVCQYFPDPWEAFLREAWSY